MRRMFVFVLAAMALISTATAESKCQAEIDAVKAFVPPTPISEKDRNTFDSALESAEQKCLEGDVEGSLDLIEQAKALVNLR